MPVSKLWLLNHDGTAFTLGSSQRRFAQLDNTWDDSVPVKRVSASHWCAWSIGHDHRVYIYVLASDVPIRVPETTYENQRWTPFHGFSGKGLIPTDRPGWSCERGHEYRPKENVRLPSAHWAWEGEWFIDDNLRGEVVGYEGWQYSFDFPGVYTPEKHWNSCVRKRKWIRFRRFSSMEVWARISDMEVVENTECFMDLSVGGFLLPSQPAGFLSVWAITNNGNVYVRTSVNHENPEGSLWQMLEIGDHMGLINVSVGSSNLVWGVTWDGHALVRNNVTKDNVYGTGWTVVEYPDEDTRLMQVSVGKHAVWAISRDGQVWFRNGTFGDDMFWSRQSAVGTSWVKMVGEMSQLSVSSNDQVFAICNNLKEVYFRTGVTRSNLTGKTWQKVELHEDLSVLARHGLLSEGSVCFCGDKNAVCELHERRPRFSSVTTSCSSISSATVAEEDSSEASGSYSPQHFTGGIHHAVIPPAWDAMRVPSMMEELPQEGSNNDDDVNEGWQLEKGGADDDQMQDGDVFAPAAVAAIESSVAESFASETSVSDTLMASTDTLTGTSVPSTITAVGDTSDVYGVVSPSASQASTISLGRSVHSDEARETFSSPPHKAAELSSTSPSASGVGDDGVISSQGGESVSYSPESEKSASSDSNKAGKEHSSLAWTSLSGNGVTDAALQSDDSVQGGVTVQGNSASHSGGLVAANKDVHDLQERSANEVSETHAPEHLSEPATKSSLPVGDLHSHQSSHSDHSVSVTAETHGAHMDPSGDPIESAVSRKTVTNGGDGQVPSHEGSVGLLSQLSENETKKSTESGVAGTKDGQRLVEENSRVSKLSSEETPLSGEEGASKSSPPACKVREPGEISPEKSDRSPKSVISKLLGQMHSKSSGNAGLKTLQTGSEKGASYSSVSQHSKDSEDSIPSASQSVVGDKEHDSVAHSPKLRRSKEKRVKISDENSIVFKCQNKKKSKKKKALHDSVTEYERGGTDSDVDKSVDATSLGSNDTSSIDDSSRYDEPTSPVPESNFPATSSDKGPGHSIETPLVTADQRELEESHVMTQSLSDDRVDSAPLSLNDHTAASVICEPTRVVADMSLVAPTAEKSVEVTRNIRGEGTPDVGEMSMASSHDAKAFSASVDVQKAPVSLEPNPESQKSISFSEEKSIHFVVQRQEESQDENFSSLPPVIVGNNTELSESNVEMTIDKAFHSLEVYMNEHNHKQEADGHSPSSEGGEGDGQGSRPPLTKQGSFENEQSRRSAEFAGSRLGSLNSSMASDEIIDFVTDLISDEEFSAEAEEKTGNSLENENCAATDTQGATQNGSGSSERGNTSASSDAGTMRQMSTASSAFSGSGSTDRGSVIDVFSPTETLSSQPLPSDDSTIPAVEPQPARKISRYRKSPTPSYEPSGPVIPLAAMTEAQPRLCWRWLDATSCVIDDPLNVPWLTTSRLETGNQVAARKKISRHLRDGILRQIVKRNEREAYTFKNIEQAINKTTWVKKAAMHMFRYDRKSSWVVCSVELEQGIGNLTEGCLTVHYQLKGKQKHTQLSLSEMTCVKTSSDPDLQSAFTVYTSMTNLIHQPLMLRANSEMEAAEWIGYLSTANASAWNLNQPIAAGAVWSCTFTGDIFVSPARSEEQKPFDLCWGQHGGHMSVVETGPSGVTWGLGFDRMAYYYNKGYGGAISSGQGALSDNTVPVTDSHRVFVYENQKWFPVVGWCNKGVFSNNFHWVTETGRSVASVDAVKLPSSKWHWISDWMVDFSTPGSVDRHGWQFCNNINGPFHAHQNIRDNFRRRRWVRRCRLTVVGPWQTAGSLELVDVSIQVDPLMTSSDPVIMWAVGANGDVLCRNGVTASNPLGKSWIHVATALDKPFKSISVGGRYRVWGIASDGSAWYRAGVTPHNPAGKRWLQVVPPPPGNFVLHQLSVGATAVWAVDTGDNLWRRENITSTFPEGTGWELVASRVKRVNVGPTDQVWIVADAYFSKMKHGPGVIYNRVGISPSKPSGTDWEVVIGSGWAHVSVRGVTRQKQQSGDPSSKKDENWEKR
ncbi:tectonin beta-propeller repeat-containing protein 1 isoform X2 [Aplysia californica]|nr:tectonin beta-propeller repeat-containing protein 1 isoform X2 [Aplysia californica]